MTANLKELLKRTKNKLTILLDNDVMEKYQLSATDYTDLVKEYLNDKEKVELLRQTNLDANTIFSIFLLISDEDLKLPLLDDYTFITKCPINIKIQMFKSLSDESKMKILKKAKSQKIKDWYDDVFKNKYDINKFRFEDILSSFSQDGIFEVLSDTYFILKELKFYKHDIISFVQKIESEDHRNKILELYNLPASPLINKMSISQKIDLLLTDKDLSDEDKIDILISFDGNSLHDFLLNNPNFCKENHIKLFYIIYFLKKEDQKIFLTKIQDLNFSFDELKNIILAIDIDVKSSIDKSLIPDEYKVFFNISSYIPNYFVEPKLVINVDLNLDPEIYRGLDKYILLNPTYYTEAERKKLLKLCDICPDLFVMDTLNFHSPGFSYRKAEYMISNFDKRFMKPEYSDAQKLAIIDYLIGKIMSYSPDYGTEIFHAHSNRSLWLSMDIGFSVCNGISQITQYILRRYGIESDIIDSKSHSFLKIKNIELPLANGQTVIGDTILDSTWNLAAHKFGAIPENFCISYKQAREHDITPDGRDKECHKNDEEISNVTLSLDEESLRKLFASIGLASKDGKFPYEYVEKESAKIAESTVNDMNSNIRLHFDLLSKFFPDFAISQNEATFFIITTFSHNKSLHYNRFVVNRVYNKSDKRKKPVLYVYIDSDELGKKFYYANKETSRMVEISQKDFEENFKCYDKDLEESKGIRPWDEPDKSDENVDSKKNTTKESDGR